MDNAKKVIIIAGPTAAGKTPLAIHLAKQYGTEIISADSRQCYKELTIGVARPTGEELDEVKHYFIASHSIHQKVTAATFEEYALQKAELIFEKHAVAIMVGGTGLYLKAFCEGLDPIPQIPDHLREELAAAYQEKGLSWLQNELKHTDPFFYASGEIQNPQRSLRALEVVKATGLSVTTFKKGTPKKRPFHIIRIVLELPKDVLYQRINNRVEEMMNKGLPEEVKSLIPYKMLNALQTVGYKELFAYFDNHLSLDQAVEDIKKATRHYAKRQLTWFRKDKAYVPFGARDEQGIANYIAATIRK